MISFFYTVRRELEKPRIEPIEWSKYEAITVEYKDVSKQLIEISNKISLLGVRIKNMKDEKCSQYNFLRKAKGGKDSHRAGLSLKTEQRYNQLNYDIKLLNEQMFELVAHQRQLEAQLKKITDSNHRLYYQIDVGVPVEKQARNAGVPQGLRQGAMILHQCDGTVHVFIPGTDGDPFGLKHGHYVFKNKELVYKRLPGSERGPQNFIMS